MITEVGNAADRVFQAMQGNFETYVKHVCASLAERCESPIEIMLGASLCVIGSFHKRCISLAPVGTDIVPDKYKNVLVIFPQYEFSRYRFDFAVKFEDMTVFIECDGHNFHERTKEQAAYDRQKDRAAQAAGFPILRFTGSEIFCDPDECAAEIVRFFCDAIDRKKTPAKPVAHWSDGEKVSDLAGSAPSAEPFDEDLL